MEAEQKVTPLELFFDLVFVFAITQVTAMMADDPTWGGVGRGMLVLAAIWWAWVGYAWLTNFLATDDGIIRAAVFGAMTAMLVVAIALPRSFGDDAVVFGGAYLLVRAIHLWIYWLSAGGDDALRASLRKVGPSWLISPAIILAAGVADDGLRYALWGLALAIDYVFPYLRGVEGWRVHAGHFAERHGLIMIIALGESIVAIGVGAAEKELTTGVLAAVALGVAVAFAMWWAYFDVVAIVAERKLHELTGAARNAQARDSYSYIHLPMIAGVVLFALGVKKTVGDYDHALKAVPAAALCGGVALYLIGHIAFRRRNVHTWSPRRIVTASILIAMAFFADEVDALVALAAVTVVICTLIAYEVTRYRDARARLRHPETLAAAGRLGS